jgi:hypothetical protein
VKGKVLWFDQTRTTSRAAITIIFTTTITISDPTYTAAPSDADEPLANLTAIKSPSPFRLTKNTYTTVSAATSGKYPLAALTDRQSVVSQYKNRPCAWVFTSDSSDDNAKAYMVDTDLQCLVCPKGQTCKVLSTNPPTMSMECGTVAQPCAGDMVHGWVDVDK